MKYLKTIICFIPLAVLSKTMFLNLSRSQTSFDFAK